VKEQRAFFKSEGMKILLVIVLLLGGFFVREELDELYGKMQDQEREEPEADEGRVGRGLVDYAENVPENHAALQEFAVQHPQAEVLLACEEDLTNDGVKDLVVVYRREAGKQSVDLVVAVDYGDGSYWFTEPIPAPVENQKIKFKNIDEKDEIEFILQGQKGSKVGYGVFRMVEGVPVNLFGEGMEDC